MKLHSLAPARGAKQKYKRVGRGPGSGRGKTAGKGHKGLLARAGRTQQVGFEGGQMPLIRRLPKRGFFNRFRQDYAVINLKSLNALEGTDEITPQTLRAAGLIKRKSIPVKILGMGELERPVVVKAHKFSEKAVGKIQSAGGRAEVISGV